MDVKDSLSKFSRSVGQQTAIFARTVGEGAVKVARESEKLTRISMLRLGVTKEKKSIKSIYEEMGKRVYGMYRNGENVDPRLLELCMDTAEREEAIYKIEEEIIELKWLGLQEGEFEEGDLIELGEEVKK